MVGYRAKDRVKYCTEKQQLVLDMISMWQQEFVLRNLNERKLIGFIGRCQIAAK
jgi:hypothetical protein